MEGLQAVVEWLRDFFGVQELLKIINSGNYRELLTQEGLLSLFRPLFPVLLLFELLKALVFRKVQSDRLQDFLLLICIKCVRGTVYRHRHGGVLHRLVRALCDNENVF